MNNDREIAHIVCYITFISRAQQLKWHATRPETERSKESMKRMISRNFIQDKGRISNKYRDYGCSTNVVEENNRILFRKIFIRSLPYTLHKIKIQTQKKSHKRKKYFE